MFLLWMKLLDYPKNGIQMTNPNARKCVSRIG